MKKRLLSLALALALCLGLAAPALAAEGDLFPAVQEMPAFTDVAEGGAAGGPWYDYESIRVCVEAGLMKGSDGAFHPGSSITVAEVAVIAARMRALSYGEEIPQGSNWYDGHIQYLKDCLQESCDLFNEGTRALMAQDAFAGQDLSGLLLDPETECPALYKDPLSPATREDFVYLLNQGAVLTDAINSISRLPDTRDPVVLSFYNAGILTGTDQLYGNFEGGKGLTRAEAAAMVARIVRPSLRKELVFLVPRAPMGEAQKAWQESHPVGIDSDAMLTLVLYLSRSTGLSATADTHWFCLDCGLDNEAVLLYLDGEGALTASFLLPYFSRLIAMSVDAVMESKGYTEAQFWSATFTPTGLDTGLDAEAYLKYSLERALAAALLNAGGNDDPSDAEIAALRERFEESPDFRALRPRALYELAADSYYAALYSADEWAAMMG